MNEKTTKETILEFLEWAALRRPQILLSGWEGFTFECEGTLSNREITTLIDNFIKEKENT
jgi:hypothetical protein